MSKQSPSATGMSNSKSLRLKLSQALGHEVKEGELAGPVAVLVHEAASQVAAEDGTEVALRDLGLISENSKTKMREGDIHVPRWSPDRSCSTDHAAGRRRGLSDGAQRCPRARSSGVPRQA